MSAARFNFRGAEPSDEPGIRAVVEAAYAPYLARMDRPPAPMLDDYADLIAAGRVIVADIDSTIAGVLVAWAEPDHYYIDNIAVDPTRHRTGLGAALLDEAERAARSVGHCELRLYTNIAMVENLTYYPRRGFVETHRASDAGYTRAYFTKAIRR